MIRVGKEVARIWCVYTYYSIHGTPGARRPAGGIRFAEASRCGFRLGFAASQVGPTCTAAAAAQPAAPRCHRFLWCCHFRFLFSKPVGNQLAMTYRVSGRANVGRRAPTLGGIPGAPRSLARISERSSVASNAPYGMAKLVSIVEMFTALNVRIARRWERPAGHRRRRGPPVPRGG